MGGKRQKKVDVKAALVTHMGNLTDAARHLGCARKTIYEAIARWPDLQDVRDEAWNELGDEAEGQLTRLIRMGNLGAVIFYLKTQHKARGYVERVEQTGKDGGAIEQRVVPVEKRPGAMDGALKVLSGTDG